MSADELKEAEARGYSRGYQAGARRKKRAIDEERREAAKRAFWLRAYLAMLPHAMAVEGWKIGEEPVRSSVQRAELAARWADAALSRAVGSGRL